MYFYVYPQSHCARGPTRLNLDSLNLLDEAKLIPYSYSHLNIQLLCLRPLTIYIFRFFILLVLWV